MNIPLRKWYDNIIVPECLEYFTDCADWAKGVAIIRHKDCGHSCFKPFSCKVFHLYPSCDQMRTLLYPKALSII